MRRGHIWRDLVRTPTALFSFVLLALIALVAITYPLWYPISPLAQNLLGSLSPPMTETSTGMHLLGTDQLGRDLMARVLLGARISLLVGGVALLISLVFGTLVGLLAGYFGGWVDAVITGATETVMALPFIVLAIAVIGALGSSTTVVILTLGLTSWVGYAKLVRARVLELREEDYVVAAFALGQRTDRVLWRHVLPNALPLIIVESTLLLGTLILAEAGLSFLGLGIQPPTPTWGGILSEGQMYVAVAPWIAVFPGVFLLLTVLATNFLGDFLRDQFSVGS